MSYQA